MIKVELRATNPMDNGMVDCGCDIELFGDIGTLAIELGNLLTNISSRYPMIMEANNDKTDINNN